jgi:hypothetical protein
MIDLKAIDAFWLELIRHVRFFSPQINDKPSPSLICDFDATSRHSCVEFLNLQFRRRLVAVILKLRLSTFWKYIGTSLSGHLCQEDTSLLRTPNFSHKLVIVCTKSLNVEIVSDSNYGNEDTVWKVCFTFFAEISQEKLNGRTWLSGGTGYRSGPALWQW